MKQIYAFFNEFEANTFVIPVVDAASVHSSATMIQCC
jgi:hypothetical protein